MSCISLPCYLFKVEMQFLLLHLVKKVYSHCCNSHCVMIKDNKGLVS